MGCSAVDKLSAPKLWLSCTYLKATVLLVWVVVGVSSPKQKALLYLQETRGKIGFHTYVNFAFHLNYVRG